MDSSCRIQAEMSAEQQQPSSSEEDELFSDESLYDPDYNDSVAVAEVKKNRRRKTTQDSRLRTQLTQDENKFVKEEGQDEGEKESTGAKKIKICEEEIARGKNKKRLKKQEPVECYVCQKPVWRIIAHLQDVHNIAENTAQEYRWRHSTKNPKNKCMICGVSRVRLDRHLRRTHNISSKDTRAQYLDAMIESAPRLKAERDKLMVDNLPSGVLPKVYTPHVFLKRFDFIWNDYSEHIRRRIFTKVRSVEESVTRKIREAIHVIELVHPLGDLQKLFKTSQQESPGDRFERLAFAKITDELRTNTNVASSWANRLRSLIGFLSFLLVFKQSTLIELGISKRQVQNVMDRAKEFKVFTEKAKSARTNTIRQEQTSQIMKRKRTVEQLRKEFDNALSHLHDSNRGHWAVQARDMLMCLLVDINASRPGPIINMTMQEFENMTYQEKDDVWVIRVASHKTYSQFGPATVFFNQTDKERLQRYATEARPLFCFQNPEHFVFITKDTKNKKGGGRQLTSSAFCKIQKKVLGYTTTLKRKKDSEKFRDSTAEKNVSQLMLHSHETHKRNYCGTATLEERLAGFKSLNEPLNSSSDKVEDSPGPSTSKLPGENLHRYEPIYSSSSDEMEDLPEPSTLCKLPRENLHRSSNTPTNVLNMIIKNEPVYSSSSDEKEDLPETSTTKLTNENLPSNTVTNVFNTNVNEPVHSSSDEVEDLAGPSTSRLPEEIIPCHTDISMLPEGNLCISSHTDTNVSTEGLPRISDDTLQDDALMEEPPSGIHELDPTTQGLFDCDLLQHTTPMVQDFTVLLKPHDIPHKLKSWYRLNADVLLDSAIPETRKWTKQDHFCLHKFLGAYKGKDNVKNISSAQIEEVISSFPQFQVGMAKFTTKQIKDKLKGWNPLHP